MEQVYKEMILELYRHPLNKKVVSNYTHQAGASNPSCGDMIELFLKFDERGILQDVGHEGGGCAISQAAVSLLTEEIKGKTKDQMRAITQEQMIDMLGIPVSHNRIKCALLGLRTLEEAIKI